MKITTSLLRALDACENQVNRFISTFGDEAEITLPNLIIAYNAQLDINWLRNKLDRVYDVSPSSSNSYVEDLHMFYHSIINNYELSDTCQSVESILNMIAILYIAAFVDMQQ